MTTVAMWLIQNAVIASVIALVLASVFRFKRPSPAFEHLLWLIVAAKFVLPPIVSFQAPVPYDITVRVLSTVDGSRFARNLADAASSRVTGMNESSADSSSAMRPAPGSVALAKLDAVAPERSDRGSGIVGLLMFIWLSGAIISLARQLFGYRAWRSATRLHASAELHELVALVARDVGVRTPRIETSGSLEAPVVTGSIRPTLVWPQSLLGAMPSDQMRTVIAHELEHIRRGDLWTESLEILAGALWWWYPAWHVVRSRLRDASERACDARVVALYPALRRRYADALLDVLAAQADRRSPAVALGLDGPGHLRRRLVSILRVPERARTSRIGRVFAVLLAFAMLPAWGLAAGSPAARPESTGHQPAGRSLPDDGIMEAMLGALRDPSPLVRRAAINALDALAVTGAPESQRSIRALLADSSPDVRSSAEQVLGIRPRRPNMSFPPARSIEPLPDSALGELLSQLRSPRNDARLRAARYLGNLKDPRALHGLIVALRDGDFHVRQDAAAALGNLGDARAVEALVAMLSDHVVHVRQSAAGALGAIGDRRAANALIAAMRDPDANVRAVAVQALANVTRR